jgi:hypothetical protein
MWSGRIFGAFILTLLSGPALAGSYGDTYWGGMDSQNVSNKDVIGSSSVFNISYVDVSRTNGGNTLKIVIHTGYAGKPGTSAALGTDYGNLFFTTASNYTPTGSASGHYATDVYQKNDWTWALVTSSTAGTPAGLYQIGAVTNTNDYYKNGKDTGVAKSYTTLDGKIIMANVNGDPISGDNGSIFRQGQAVQYTPDGQKGLVAGSTGSRTIVNGSTITYLINDQHTLGDTFAMSWAMTCANDVFQRVVSVPGPVVGGGLPGLLAVIAGFWAWRRRSERVSISLA